MDKAFLCPHCGAQILLSEAADNVCCFCSSNLTEKDKIESVDWAFHVPSFAAKTNVRTFVCDDCKKVVFSSKECTLPLSNCVFCGSRSIKEDPSSPARLPVGISTVPFIYSREDALEQYLQDVKKEGMKLHFAKKSICKDCINPVYLPCFLYDYAINATTVITVLPIVKKGGKGERILDFLTGDDLTLERTSAAEPYPKQFIAEMIWQNVPVPSATCIESTLFERISPFSVRSTIDDENKIASDAFYPGIDLNWKSVDEELKSEVRNWIREYVLSENMEHYQISSFVDKTKYETGLGQLIYIPIWHMRFKRKSETFSWYMNGLTGVSSGFVETVSEAEETDKADGKKLEDLNKKKIRTIKNNEVSNSESSVNCRTYMVDTVSSSIMLETQLNESASDKSLFHLERSMKGTTVSISIPDVEAYEQPEDEETKKMREAPIPSVPVPLPTEHSPLYMMKQEIQNRKLGRGMRLPETPVDRNVGNEASFGYDDITREEKAVEVALSDMPEFDPSGPNPFKKKE